MGIGISSSKFEIDPIASLTRASASTKQLNLGKGEMLFAQGQPADSVFYIHQGRVSKSRISPSGRTGVVGIFGSGEFIGIGCIAGSRERLFTASAVTDCSVARIELAAMLRALNGQPDLAEEFITFLIERGHRYEEDVASHLFHSSEQRLARTLCVLANGGGGKNPQENTVPQMTQELLAEVVGTTRARINFFMNKFRKLGLIEYKHGGQQLRVLPELAEVYEKLE